MKITNELSKEMRDELDYKLEFLSVCEDILSILRQEDYKDLVDDYAREYREENSHLNEEELENSLFPKSDDVMFVIQEEMQKYISKSKSYFCIADLYYIKKLVKEIIKNLNKRSEGCFEDYLESSINQEIRGDLKIALKRAFSFSSEEFTIEIKDSEGMVISVREIEEIDVDKYLKDIVEDINNGEDE